MPYQSFVDQPGSSKSAEKLCAFQLPASMSGQSFLDVGCNEGFFCMEAKRRGAKVAVGIDKEAEFINKARRRASEAGMDITYICDTWDNLPAGTFDIILVASALHYVTSPLLFFDAIYDRLADNGLLILECGDTTEMMEPDRRGYPRPRFLLRVVRAAGPCFYPYRYMLVNDWLRRFAVLDMGNSVMQGGDPILRKIYHCRKWRTSVIFVPGGGATGKSSIASRLTSTKNIIETDQLFKSRFADGVTPASEEAKYRDCLQANGNDITVTWDKLCTDPGVVNYFVENLVKKISLYRGTDVVIVEGYVLRTLLPIICPMLESRGFRCWILSKGQK